jgi:hypothetical protein
MISREPERRATDGMTAKSLKKKGETAKLRGLVPPASGVNLFG